MSNYRTYNDPVPCPYCGKNCYAEFVDVGVGMVQCGPYRCDSCNAYEIGTEFEYEYLEDENGHYAGGILKNADKFSAKEIETGWFEPSVEKQITCIGCNKTPDEIDEYVTCAGEESVNPTQYVIQNEGTYNVFLRDKFYCTSCYIKAGQPTIKRGA